MPSRYLKRVYHLDANRINARQKASCVNQLERWHANGVIFLEMSRVAYDEAGYGSPKRSAKADEYTWVSTNDSIGGEANCRRAIERIVFPNGARNQNQVNDIWILFAARQAGATLITRDGGSQSQLGGILGNAKALAEIGIAVLSDQEALEEIKILVRERDRKARFVSERSRKPLPDWVGKDDPDSISRPLST